MSGWSTVALILFAATLMFTGVLAIRLGRRGWLARRSEA